MRAVAFALVCFGVVFAAWWTEHPAGLHPPEPRETLNRINAHSWLHACGAFLTTLVGAAVFRVPDVTAALIAFAAWASVELIQYYPRRPYALYRREDVLTEPGTYRITHRGESRTGSWEWLDLVFDAGGVALALALFAVLGTL